MSGSKPWRSPVVRKLIVVTALLSLWEVGVRVSDVSPVLVPPPSAVFGAAWQGLLSGELLASTWATLENLLIAMAIGIALATLLNIAASLSSWGRDVLSTLTAALNPLPAIAVLPIAFLWLGIGRSSLIFVLVNSVIWAMALNMYTGFATVPKTLCYVGANLGLEGFRLFRYVLVPAALAHIYTGLKISWAFGWRTVIAAELVFGATSSGSGGLGWMIYRERYNLNSPGVFAGLLTIIVIGLLVEAGFQAVERRTIRRWGMAV